MSDDSEKKVVAFPQAEAVPEEMVRAEAVVMSLVTVTYRRGRPVAEAVSQPFKVFLGAEPELTNVLQRVLGGAARQ